MAKVIVKMRVMPENPEVDLDALEKKISEKIIAFSDMPVSRVDIVPVAFGLKSLEITYAVEESKGDTEPLENDIASLDEVASVEVTSVSRALG